MEEKVNVWPIISIIAAAAGGLIIFSIAQFKQQQTIQEKKVQALAADHAETERVMKAIGEAADRGEGESDTPQNQSYAARSYAAAVAIRKLDAQDEAEWRAKHHLAPQPIATNSAAH